MIKLSDNVKLDTDNKIMYVNFSKLSETDKMLIEYNKAGYIVAAMPKPRKSNQPNKAAIVAMIGDNESLLNEFNRRVKADGFFSARAWYMNQGK